MSIPRVDVAFVGDDYDTAATLLDTDDLRIFGVIFDCQIIDHAQFLRLINTEDVAFVHG